MLTSNDVSFVNFYDVTICNGENTFCTLCFFILLDQINLDLIYQLSFILVMRRTPVNMRTLYTLQHINSSRPEVF